MTTGGATAATHNVMSDTSMRSVGSVLEPDAVADAVLDAMHDERFLVLPHPEVLEYFGRKVSDYDRWLGGMRRLRASWEGE
jgi:hypothetical protein